MLTFDDLDHFADRTLPQLFDDPSLQEQAEILFRRQRSLACLQFCSGIPNQQLPEGGLHAARRHLRKALRRQQRNCRLPLEEMLEAIQGALQLLGEPAAHASETPEAAQWRQAVEREIETVAVSGSSSDTVAPDLLEALAMGEFELVACSDEADLEAVLQKLKGPAPIWIELALDRDGPPARARIEVAMESRLWRWRTCSGSSLSLDGQEPVELSPEDALLAPLLAGITVRDGRAILGWARAAQP